MNRLFTSFSSSLMTTPLLKKSWTPTSVYFGLATLIGLIWSIITLSIFLSSTASLLFITDKEYLAQNYREVQNCEDPSYDHIKEKNIEKTEEEISLCKTNTEERITLQRSIRYKETAIESAIWFLIFGLVFWFHYSYFRKMD